MKTTKFVVASVTALTISATALAHELPFKGRTALTITGFDNGVFTFDVNGRITPLLKVTGSGKFMVNNTNGDFSGGMTLIDHHGDQVILTFDAVMDRGGGYHGTFKITGGTGHWIGHVGGGNIKGTVGDATIGMNFDGVIDH